MLNEVQWKYCIKDKCDEGYRGRCNRPNWDIEDGDYPEKECIEPFMYDLSWVDDWETTDIRDAFDKDELEAALAKYYEQLAKKSKEKNNE